MGARHPHPPLASDGCTGTCTCTHVCITPQSHTCAHTPKVQEFQGAKMVLLLLWSLTDTFPVFLNQSQARKGEQRASVVLLTVFIIWKNRCVQRSRVTPHGRYKGCKSRNTPPSPVNLIFLLAGGPELQFISKSSRLTNPSAGHSFSSVPLWPESCGPERAAPEARG